MSSGAVMTPSMGPEIVLHRPVAQKSAFNAYSADFGLRDRPLFLAAQQALIDVQAAATGSTYQSHADRLSTPRLLRLGGGPPPARAFDVERASQPTGTRVKLHVTCNDVRGIVFLDQQVVSCFCPTCDARVAGGHDRPLFSFTRFERHTGSKAKKWRLSLRIVPGSVPECPVMEPPMSLGQWLDIKGLSTAGQRQATSNRIGDDPSDESDSATHSAETSPRLGGAGEHAAKRQRTHALRHGQTDAWVTERLEAMRAAAEGAWRDRHHAVFQLVLALLRSDGDLFHTGYMPWLNEIGAERLEQEFHTLRSYLELVERGESPAAVRGMMKAYVGAVVARQWRAGDAPRQSPGRAADGSSEFECDATLGEREVQGAPMAVPDAEQHAAAAASTARRVAIEEAQGEAAALPGPTRSGNASELGPLATVA